MGTEQERVREASGMMARALGEWPDMTCEDEVALDALTGRARGRTGYLPHDRWGLDSSIGREMDGGRHQGWPYGIEGRGVGGSVGEGVLDA